ncbi:MAG TPA: hypothetical protein VE396_15600 [Xanthobacteraceae bacterium]|nr:hypothetical protein [Xanthobacteraceae bacterium]
MTNTSSSSDIPVWPAWPMWPFGLFDRSANAAVSVDQPINPGWTFGNVINIDEHNSSAPGTERNIVAAESYGRQLGRIMDAVAELIAERPFSAQKSPALIEFIALRDKIDKIKTQSAANRLDRIAADLAELRSSNEPEYQRLAKKLRNALADQDRAPP